MTEDTYIEEYSVNKSVKLSTYIAPLQRVQETLAIVYTVFQKKTSTHIIGYKLRNSCPILIIFDIKISHII